MSKMAMLFVVLGCSAFSIAEGILNQKVADENAVVKSELKDTRKKLTEIQDSRYLCQQVMEQCCN